MSKSRHFAIAGAGIAGLASAIALARGGHQVTVLEQAARIDEVGAGLQIGPNAARALQWLDVWDQLEPSTVAPGAIVIRNGQTGRILSQIELGSAFERRFGAPYRVAHRADLIAALLHTANSMQSITIRTDCPLDSHEIAGNGVNAHLLSGQTIAADALIGADGIRSRTRQNILDDGPPGYAGHAIYRTLLPMIDVPASTDTDPVTLWLYPGGHVVHYPVSGGRRLNIVAAANSLWVEDDWKTPAAGKEVTALFPDADDTLRDLLTAPAGWLKWAAADRAPVATWGSGPVSLIGDAAHATLPYLAQGAAMALEDAVVLGQYCSNCDDVPAELRSYEAIRQPRTARVTARSRKLGTLYHLQSLPAVARNIAITALPGTANLSNLSWLYSWQP